MNRTQLICLGLLILLCILVFRLAYKILCPMLDIIENFDTTTCPDGFDGPFTDTTDNNVYCKKGEKSCSLSGKLNHTLCKDVKEEILREKDSLCPPSKPFYTRTNKCCKTAKNGRSDCEVGSSFCTGQECSFQRMKETAVCPSNMQTVLETQIEGMTTFACTNNSAMCFTPTALLALQQAGKNTSALTTCDILPVECTKKEGKKKHVDFNGLKFYFMDYTKEECESMGGTHWNVPGGACGKSLTGLTGKFSDAETLYYYNIECTPKENKDKIKKANPEVFTKNLTLVNGTITKRD